VSRGAEELVDDAGLLAAVGQIAREPVEDLTEWIGSESSDVMGSRKERIEHRLPSREGDRDPEKSIRIMRSRVR
jgi:hypothetical protein